MKYKDINFNVSEAVDHFSYVYKIEKELILAIIEQESNFDTNAIRYEKNWKWFFKPSYWSKKLRITDETERQLQMFSFGLMQVMGGTARELSMGGNLTQLLYPYCGIEFGCKYLKKQLDRYNYAYNYAISAYNAGTAKVLKNGPIDFKLFKNQDYVDSVLEKYSKYKSEAK